MKKIAIGVYKFIRLVIGFPVPGTTIHKRTYKFEDGLVLYTGRVLYGRPLPRKFSKDKFVKDKPDMSNVVQIKDAKRSRYDKSERG